MRLDISFIAVACVVALSGCAAEDEITADGTERGTRADPLTLTLEGYGEFSGVAEYDVSEPSGEETPEPELRLNAARFDTGEAVTLTLGQPDLGALKALYVFPSSSLQNAFQVTLDGQVYEGQVGEVKLDADGGHWIGEFALTSLPRDDDKGELGTDSVMLRGSFRFDRLDVNCHRLVEDKGGSASSPGHAGAGGASPVWTPDVLGESAFCRQMKSELSAPGG